MIAHTNGFKDAITTLGRDINVLIDYYAVVYNLITEDNKLIITQDNMELLTENMSTQEPTSQLTNDDIISLNKNNLGELFRTYMKSFDLETTHKFNVGDKMIIKVGTSVNGEIECLNYGLYYVYERTYNKDKETYTYTLCDRMLFAMQQYDNATCFGENTQLTCKQLITNILTEQCGFDANKINLDDSMLINKDKIIYKDTFDGKGITCRDVLDMIMQLQGCSLVIGFSERSRNLFNCNDYSIIDWRTNSLPSNIVKTNNSISYRTNGTRNFCGVFIRIAELEKYVKNFDTNTNYYVSADITVDKSCTFGRLQQADNYITIPIGKTRIVGYGKIPSDISFYVRYATDGVVNVKIENIMISTSSDTSYVPFIPDYDYIETKTISSSSVDTIDNSILKDKNINFNGKYGKLNSLLFSRASDVDNIERKDDASIEEYGKTQYVIDNNLILDQDNRETFIDNLFNYMNGLEYYKCNVDIIGLGYIEYLDRFTINTGTDIYNTICLKNTSKISNGMSENFKSEELIETKNDYDNVGISDKNASITLNKLKGEIVLKTYQEGNKTKIAQVRLDSTGDEGSLVEISGDQINLTADDIHLEGYTTINGNFKIDSYGNMECKNAKMTGANITGGKVKIEDAIPDEAYFLLGGTYQSINWSNDYFLFQQHLYDEHYYRELMTGYSSIYDEMSVYLKHNTTDKYEAEMRVKNNQARVEVLKNDYGCGLDAVNGFINISDKKAKENIKNIDEKKSLNIITKLEPVEFNYKKDEKTHRGLIAQDVIKVLNDNDIEGQVYSYSEEKELYSLNYIELIPDLINCIKYQQKQIEELKKEIEELKGGKK